MNRRTFASLTVAGGAAVGTLTTSKSIAAQTPDASPQVSVAGVWESAEDPVTVEYDPEFFGEASTSGVTGEWCVLRVPDIDRFMSVIIKLEEKFPTTNEELLDYVENDEELDYPGQDAEITRRHVTEGEGAVGVLYQAHTDASPDTWSYSEFTPSEDGSRRTIQVWIASRRSKLDRELHEAAINSITINGEPVVQAVEVSELFDQVEEIEAPAAG